jgi:hypothetical protein
MASHSDGAMDGLVGIGDIILIVITAITTLQPITIVLITIIQWHITHVTMVAIGVVAGDIIAMHRILDSLALQEVITHDPLV